MLVSVKEERIVKLGGEEDTGEGGWRYVSDGKKGLRKARERVRRVKKGGMKKRRKNVSRRIKNCKGEEYKFAAKTNEGFK